MSHFTVNQNGQLLNSCNQQVGSVNQFGQVTSNYGMPTMNRVTNGVIRDGYYNVVGTVNPAPIVFNTPMHP